MALTLARAAKDLIHQSLEAHPEARLFVILDPSRDSMITTLAQGLSERAECLYIGSTKEEFEDDAPWLVQCGDMDGFSDTLIDSGFGQNKCVFLVSRASFDELFRHFRRLTKIRQVNGPNLFFRYYDPEVLGSMIPFLTPKQRQYVFGPCLAFLMEFTAGHSSGFGKMHLHENGDVDTVFTLEDEESPSMQKALIGDPTTSLAGVMTFDLEGADTRPTLILTQAQLEAPLLFNRPKLVASTIEYLQDDFGEAMSVMPPMMLAQNINHGIDVAISYQIFDVSNIHLFVDLMMRIAPGWHRQTKLRNVLSRTDVTPERRFEIMLQSSYDEAWEDARRFNDPDEWIESDKEAGHV